MCGSGGFLYAKSQHIKSYPLNEQSISVRKPGKIFLKGHSGALATQHNGRCARLSVPIWLHTAPLISQDADEQCLVKINVKQNLFTHTGTLFVTNFDVRLQLWQLYRLDSI